jgi:hypothetical protein
MNIIDFRDHDIREHGLTLTERVTEIGEDMNNAMAQRIRLSLREQEILRTPITEDEQFAMADARMRNPA